MVIVSVKLKFNKSRGVVMRAMQISSHELHMMPVLNL
jgi:hypothetical protein